MKGGTPSGARPAKSTGKQSGLGAAPRSSSPIPWVKSQETFKKGKKKY